MEMENTLKRVNVGCGQTPTPGWLNFDNSVSIRLAKHHMLVSVVKRLGLLGEGQKRFVSFAQNNDITWADATKRIPLANNSVEVLYTSHMVEHLDREEAKLFLQEACRVLAPNGIIRIAVPDIKKLVDRYLIEGNADLFIERSLLTHQRRSTLLDRLKYLILGDRHHLWMYDGPSMVRLLSEAGFKESRILEPGSTTIPNPGELNLHERAEESVYVEGHK
jgi:hypothetical protein